MRDKERLEQAHRLMGISNQFSLALQNIFNEWTKVRITDSEVKKLIALALVPNMEVYQSLQSGKEDETSTHFKNICDAAFNYAMTNSTQVLPTTRGTLFGAYNAVTGYFQNVRSYKDGEAKLKSILFGGTAQMRSQKAFNLCADYAGKGASALFLN